MAFLRDRRVTETLISVLVLLGSYLAAKAVSYIFEKILTRVAERTPSRLDDNLVAALRRPLTVALFLVGAFIAVHRLPIPALWLGRLDSVLYVIGVLLLTLALLRSYGIVLRWYMTESKAAASAGITQGFGPLLSKLGKLVIALLAVIAILQHLGVNVASLVVSLGVGSLAVGLAAQDTLANMFAGFTLMLDRPFRVGDRIQLATGEVGDVESIGMRATHLRTQDEMFLIVPNSSLVKERLVNHSRPTARVAVRVEVGVGYGTDLALAMRLLREAAATSPHFDKEKEPVVFVTRFGDFAVNLQLTFWVTDYRELNAARTEAHVEIDRRLREAGIEAPSPTTRLLREQIAPAEAEAPREG
jgi:small-conductance mechanosensitive channel